MILFHQQLDAIVEEDEIMNMKLCKNDDNQERKLVMMTNFKERFRANFIP